MKLSRSLRHAGRATPGAAPLPSEASTRAETLRARLVAAEANLRGFCRHPNFGGDAEACRNVADQVKQFLAGPFTRLSTSIANGDAHRYSAVMLAGSNILKTAEGAPNDLGKGLIITAEVEKTAGELVQATRKAALAGVGIYFAAAGVAVGTKLAGLW